MSKSPTHQTITIFSQPHSLGLADSDARAIDLPVDELRKNLGAFAETLKTLLPTVAEVGGGFGLTALEVAVGIDGKGHVGFLGTGVDVGAKATITLTFGREKA